MPFGKWKDFEDCVEDMKKTQGYDEETAKKVCGKIKREVEGTTNEEPERIYLGKTNKVELTNGILEIKGTLLAEGYWNRVFYSADEITKADISKLKNSVITCDHERKWDKDVGIMIDAWVDNGTIKYRGYIDEPQAVRKLINRMKTLKKAEIPIEQAIGISAELFADVELNRELKRLEAKNLRLLRGSLVVDPACPKGICTVEPEVELSLDELATACEARYMNKDRTKFKEGQKGCERALIRCRGLDYERAHALCWYIMHRRKGATKSEGSSMLVWDVYKSVIDEYEKRGDEFIEEIRKIMPKVEGEEGKMESEKFDDKEIEETLATECMKKYLNPDGTFKDGFEGCVKAMQDCKGLPEENARKLCAYIGRKTGKIPAKKESEQTPCELVDELDRVFDELEIIKEYDEVVRALMKENKELYQKLTKLESQTVEKEKQNLVKQIREFDKDINEETLNMLPVEALKEIQRAFRKLAKPKRTTLIPVKKKQEESKYPVDIIKI